MDQSIVRYINTLDFNRFSNEIALATTRLPFGLQQLNPVLQNDIAAVDPTAPGAGSLLHQQIRADVNAYVQAGVASGAFTFNARGVPAGFGTAPLVVASPTRGTRVGYSRSTRARRQPPTASRGRWDRCRRAARRSSS